MTARFCLVCGSRLGRVTEGRRRRGRCRRCGWTFYGNPAPATTAVVFERGRVLLARRARPPYAGYWDLPGGFLEAGEAPETGLRRELREELGVAAARVHLIGFATDRYGPRGVPILNVIYRARTGKARLRPGDDVAQLGWFPPGEVPWRAIPFLGMRRVLRRYLAAARRPLRGSSRRRRADSS